MHVTSLRLSLSCHRERSSPVLIDQHRTSSFAPTYALPAPVERAVLVLSGVQMELEVAVQTVPKDVEGSYFLW